jgi:hypothetical protein
MSEIGPEEFERLRFRRQFILGSEVFDRFPSWQRVRVASELWLQAHPDLTVTQTVAGPLELTLVGCFLDPENPSYTNAQVLRGLSRRTRVVDDVFRATAGMGGRWVLIVSIGQQAIFFADPSGLRQVCYTISTDRRLWCASEPTLLAEQLGLRSSPQAERFLASPYVRSEEEYWWPGDSTLFSEISHLLPNHFLDLTTKTSHRFWPWAPLQQVSLAEGVQRGAELLSGLLKSAANRFPLAVPITAGLDSRMLLAAAREVKDEVFYYTLRKRHTPAEDIEVPARLLRRLGVTHHVIDATAPAEEAFWQLYRANTYGAHKAWSDIAFSLHNHYPSRHVAISGNCAEIARCYYSKPGRVRRVAAAKVTVRDLLYQEGMDGNAFSLEHIGRWFDEAAPQAIDNGYDLLDLFYWEQRMGRWQASAQLEWDIAQETVSPFNCRALISTWLGVDSAFRIPPSSTLFLEMTHRLWPEVLSEPVNPESSARKLLRSAKRQTFSLLGRTPLLTVYRRIRGIGHRGAGARAIRGLYALACSRVAHDMLTSV